MPTWYDEDGDIVVSTNFTDAKGRHYINGTEVPDSVYDEWLRLAAERNYLREALEKIASSEGWFAKDSGGRQRLAQEVLDGDWRPDWWYSDE